MSNTEEQKSKAYIKAQEIVNTHQLHHEQNMISISGYNEWLVKSSMGDSYYRVTFDKDEGYGCNCPYFQMKGQCKHIKAVKITKEQRIYCPMNGDRGGEEI